MRTSPPPSDAPRSVVRRIPASAVVREWSPNDPTPQPGEWVVYGCPICDWRSLASLVVDRQGGAWAAYGLLLHDWRNHWLSRHTPNPDQLIGTIVDEHRKP